MAYFPILNDILEARFITFDPTAPPQVGVNRVRYKVTNIGGAGVSDVRIAQQLDANVSAAYKALIATPCLYRGVMLNRLFPGGRTFRAVATANAGAGTAGANQAPTQVSGLIKANTARAGRAFRGRLYIPFPAAADVTAQGNVSAGYITNLIALIAVVYAPFATTVGADSAICSPVIFHPKGFGTPPVGVNTSDLIENATAVTLWATERRRGNFGRANSTPPI